MEEADRNGCVKHMQTFTQDTAVCFLVGNKKSTQTISLQTKT